MRKFIFALIFIVLSAVCVFAQGKNEKSDALAVIEKMFAEMAAFDPEAIKTHFAPDAHLAVVVNRKDGTKTTEILTGETFSKFFVEKKGSIEERMYQPKTEIYNDLAMVWGRYIFFIDGKISHCGVDSFHLVKTADGWKIINASSTIEPQGCTAKEKKMRAAN